MSYQMTITAFSGMFNVSIDIIKQKFHNKYV